ncbi:alkaline phosphatase PhoX [Woodsholea maritima]|uniref:alkaline phosphatase PhoX n=1 Tax=Woodsholea maritima TaxID=240237 RepID=UPI00037655AA|nr:alkaline phosphatase PhoX [Woodsholea maritima]
MSLSRRTFLQVSGLTTGAFAGLSLLASCKNTDQAPYINQVEGYGPLSPDPEGLFDLPEGFTHQVISQFGDEMDDGLRVPGRPDGMAAFQGPDNTIILVRNHEINPGHVGYSAFGDEDERLSLIDRDKVYDWVAGNEPHHGGTTTIHVDNETLAVRRQFLSLAGTDNNCAGGPTPWGSWISCEESLDLASADPSQGSGKDHGYAFEVPALAETLVEPRPLLNMGRFEREAVAIDPVSGAVYQTEDDRPALLYRFIPDIPGDLHGPGRQQALMIKGRPGLDTRNWEDSPETITLHTWMDVEWVDLEDIHNPNNDLATRGIALGAARFTRGEGAWFDKGELYFCCTDGGPAHIGQIWRYHPSPAEGLAQEADQPGQLQLFVETTDARVMEKCDNITIAPWGDLIVVEDGDEEQFIRGVTPQGQVYTIGRNAVTMEDGEKSEITGPCFSPDGKTLFFNVQSGPGRTFAVRGPWQQRSLAQL